MREPPRLVERLLRRLLPRGPRGDALLGDLREEYERRAESNGAGDDAAAWYRREAGAIGLRYGLRALRTQLDDVVQDAWHATRRLRRSPGYVVVSVIVLALGIGANAATFAFVDALAFRPLPVAEPERLVALFVRDAGTRVYEGFSSPDLEDYRDGAGVFEALAGFSDAPAALSGDGSAAEAVMVWTSLVTEDYFRVVQPRAQLGRLLREGDVASVVLSDALWRSRFGGDPGVVGSEVTLNGHVFEVVGVAPRGFTGTRLFSFAPELWAPASAHMWLLPGSEGLLQERSNSWLHLVGRLGPGVSLTEAEIATQRVTRSLGESFPETHGGREPVLFSNAQAVNPWAFEPAQLRRTGMIALVGVALVLLIACANVASLQLARSVEARRQTAVRLSLGASRSRIARGVLIESLILALAGGAAGVLLAQWLVQSSAVLLPPLEFAPAYDVRIDWRVIAFTLLAAGLAAVLAGVLPVLRQIRIDPATTLRGGTGGTHRTSRLHDGLVVAQMALSVVVLVAAGLFTRSLSNARGIDAGFPLSDGMVLNVDPVLQGYSSERARDYYDRMLEGLRALPGVDGATRANHLPLDGSAATRRVSAEGRTASADEQLSALFYAVEPGFFATLGMPILEGREFIAGDDSTAGLVTVVNQALARRLWPDEPAVGKRMVVGERVATVIGLAADAKFMFLRESPEPMFALSLRQSDNRAGALLVRTSVDPRTAMPAIRGVAFDIDPRIALSGLNTLRENARYSLTAAESGATGATTFGLLALLLSAAGLYGVVSHAVARRVREIGIRMALGARGRSVVSMVVGRGLRLGLAGVAIGAVLALAAGRVLSGMLYGVAPADALTFLAVAGVLVLVSVLASWAPSRRAASVDPLSVLKSD